MISQFTRRLLTASKVKGVGKRTLLSLAKDKLFFQLPIEEWHSEVPQLSALRPGTSVFAHVASAVERDLEEAARLGAEILSVCDPSYPMLLNGIPDRPPILYVRGGSSRFSDKALAIIGTREPSEHGRITAERLTTYFATQGWQVVSGLAIGIDTIAHSATIGAGGTTVAVLAHGLETVYPKQNAALAEQILECGGLLVSEYPFGSPSFPAHFVERDRIQAGLARGVVMIQSGLTGGSWHASRSALSYQRFLFVPRATKRDSEHREPKALGNIVMAEGSEDQKLDILKCAPTDLDRVVVLNSREDYITVEEILSRETQPRSSRPT